MKCLYNRKNSQVQTNYTSICNTHLYIKAKLIDLSFRFIVYNLSRVMNTVQYN